MRLINKPMKRLSLYLFLLFFTLQTPSQADDIRDFQIEGMSVGDSLLDYINKEDRKKKKLKIVKLFQILHQKNTEKLNLILN